MRMRQPCFLNTTEWQAVICTTDNMPYHESQRPSLSVRTKLGAYMVQLPEAVRDYHALLQHRTLQVIPKAAVIELINRIITIFDGIQHLLVHEIEPLCNIKQDAAYPDLIAGVQHCVANTTLVSLYRMLSSLRKIEQTDGNETQPFPYIEPPGVQIWRARAVTAYEYVREQSTSAAKPLLFGLQQIEENTWRPI